MSMEKRCGSKSVVGSVCARARVCVSGGGREGEGSLSATVDSDNFNGASHEQRILYENTFACH